MRNCSFSKLTTTNMFKMELFLNWKHRKATKCRSKHQKVTYWSFFALSMSKSYKIASKIEFFRSRRYPFGQSCLLIWIFYVSNHVFNGCGEKNNLIMQRISKKSTSGSTLMFILLRLFWVFLQNYFKLQIFFVIRYRHLFLIHRWKGQHYLISFTITNSHKHTQTIC